MFGLLPTRIHGFLDYLMGAALIVVPLAFDFGAGPQTWLPVLLGGGTIIYSLLTDYELGVVPLFGMTAHLMMDGLGGLLLASSPWLFGFSWEIWIPHLLFGLAAVAAAIFTRTQTLREPTPLSGAKAPA